MSTYLPYVGFVQFPRNPRDLSDQVCPACLVDRTGATCAGCGLDLGSPLIALLDSSSMDAAAALDRRLELIGQIRFDSAEVRAEQPAPVSSPVQAAVAPPAAALEQPPVSAAVSTAAPAQPSLPAAPRRHIGVQVILLITGVSLLSIGAIFFLVYAFINFGLVWRTVIILAVTVAAIAGASILRRRKLRVTAEGIAALAVVLVYLDIYAVRANDFFGASAASQQVYWGGFLLLSAIAFAAWHRLSGLRVPSVVASIVFAPGAALLISGVLDGAEDSVRAFGSFGALAVAGLAFPAFRNRVEKIIVAGFSVLGLGLAAATSPLLLGPFDSDAGWNTVFGFGLVAVAALAHVWLVARLGGPVITGRLATVIGAISVSVATLFVAFRADEAGLVSFWPVVVAAIVALGLELLARGLHPRLPSHFAQIAAKTAAVVGMLILLIPFTFAVMPTISLTSAGSPRWTTTGASFIPFQPENAAAMLALLAVVVLVAAAWAIAGTLDERLLVIIAAGFATLLLAVPLVGVLWAAVAAWLLIAAAGLVTLRVARMRGWGIGIRITIAVGSLVSMVLAYLSSWASIDTWWYGSVGVIVILVAARAITSHVVLRAATLGVAVVLAFVAIAAEGHHINDRFAGGADPVLESSLAVAILAVLLLAAAAGLASRLSGVETRVMFWLSVAGATGAVTTLWITGAIREDFAGLVLPYRLTTVLLGFGLVAALALFAGLARTATLKIERIAASVVLGLAAAWALESLTRLAMLPDVAVSAAPNAAALIVSAAALALALRGSGLRVAMEIGAAIVAIPGAIVATQSDAPWLVLVILSVTALIFAVSRDGIFTSIHGRKHIGWLALALAVGGLWWALADAGNDSIEVFVLPLAGALLTIALLIWRGASRIKETTVAAHYIAFAALLVAILPIAIVAMTGPTVRTVIITASAAAVLITASVYTRTGPLRPYLDGAAIASAAGILIAGFGRPLVVAMVPRVNDLQIDAWAAATFVVLVTAAILQSKVTDAPTRRRRTEAAEVLVIMAVVGIVIIEIAVSQATTLGTIRAATLLVLLATMYSAAHIVDRPPLRRIVGWIALTGAVVVAIAASIVGAIEPFEWATGILSAALLVVGAVRLRRDAALRSWPGLAPGILVLLLPSLFATVIDAPIWRLVGLGVACVILIVVGALAHLRAPLVVGSVVVVVHAIRTFAPQIVAVYQLTEWWVWAVIGGAIILFVAITLEKRVRDLKSMGSRISALR